MTGASPSGTAAIPEAGTLPGSAAGDVDSATPSVSSSVTARYRNQSATAQISGVGATTPLQRWASAREGTSPPAMPMARPTRTHPGLSCRHDMSTGGPLGSSRN